MFHKIKNGWQCEFIIQRVEMLILYHYNWVWDNCGSVLPFCVYLDFLPLRVHELYIVILQMCFTDMPTAVSSNTWRNIKSNQTAKCFFWWVCCTLTLVSTLTFMYNIICFTKTFILRWLLMYIFSSSSKFQYFCKYCNNPVRFLWRTPTADSEIWLT